MVLVPRSNVLGTIPALNPEPLDVVEGAFDDPGLTLIVSCGSRNMYAYHFMLPNASLILDETQWHNL